jgi:hypothetical protein
MTRRSALVFAAAIAILLVAGITEPAQAAPSAAASTWGAAADPLRASIGIQDALIEQLSCASAGNCTAFGIFQTAGGPQTPFAVTEKGGKWQLPQALVTGNTANYLVFAVSCASPGNCAAGGSAPGPSQVYSAFVITQVNGKWGPVTDLVGTANPAATDFTTTTAISCSAPGRCTAGGQYTDEAGLVQGWVSDEQPNGTWAPRLRTAANLNAGKATVTGVSCASPGNCAVVGWYTDSSNVTRAFTADKRGGVWFGAQPVPGPLTAGTATLASVSCDAPGDCVAGGSYKAATGNEAFVVREKNFTWGTATELPGTGALNKGGDARVTSVSCRAPGSCSAGGHYTDAAHHQQAFVAAQHAGLWAKAVEVPGLGPLNAGGKAEVTSLSCASAGNCAAGGDYFPSANAEDAFVVSERNGSWQRAQLPRGVAAPGGRDTTVVTVTCPAVSYCGAAGFYLGSNGFVHSWVASGSVSQPTTAAEKLSAGTVKYGHEQSVRVSVTVTPKFHGPAVGTVTVLAGSVKVCVIALRNGAGSCAPAARKLAPGTHKLVARYAGNVTYQPALSGPRTLTVKR